MNRRKVISQMKAHCESVAAVMAADTYDFSQSGVPMRITNKIAIDTLSHAYEKFINNNCKLITQRITLEQSKAFPRNSEITVQACSVLAVTNDIDTHVVYGLQYCDAPFLTKEQRYEIATRAAIEEVCWHAGYAGFPIYKPLV